MSIVLTMELCRGSAVFPTYRCHCLPCPAALDLALLARLGFAYRANRDSVLDQMHASRHGQLYVNFSTRECEAAAMNVVKDAQRHPDPFI
jgi:hypothetical protein